MSSLPIRPLALLGLLPGLLLGLLLVPTSGLAPSAAAGVSAQGTTSAGAARTAPIPKGFPRIRTTGAHGRLRAMSGRTVTRRGVVIANRVVTGQLTIKADDVTLRNVVVRTNDTYGVLVHGRRAHLLHTTVVGRAPNTLAGIAATDGASFVARAVRVRGSEDGVRLTSGSVLRDSMVYGLAGDSSSHFDGVTADGYTGWRVQHNTILNRHDLVGAVWVGDSRFGPSAGLLANNYLAGGGYTVYAGTGVAGSGIRVVGNRFSTRFFPDSGYWGVVYDWRSANNTWSGNTWADGPRRGRTVTP
jgi:hypothetical protein